MSKPPSTDHEWIIHSINIHGVFFERWCQKTISEKSDWKVRSINYPVEYPPPNGLLRGKESALDIRAELKKGDRLFTLLIECKKNNPDFVNWIFFPKHNLSNTHQMGIVEIENFPRQLPAIGWDVKPSIRSHPTDPNLSDEARETRGSYAQHQKGDKTKTSNAAISDAAYQVALATKAIVDEEARFSQALGASGQLSVMPWRQQTFLPMIVTSAHLFICKFDARDVNPITGEIDYTKAVLEEKPFIYYEYPLPNHLQSIPEDLVAVLNEGIIESFKRMTIYVVHSGKFSEVLEVLSKRLQPNEAANE